MEQRYKRAADWGLVQQAANRLTVPVIGNGDVLTYYEVHHFRSWLSWTELSVKQLFVQLTDLVLSGLQNVSSQDSACATKTVYGHSESKHKHASITPWASPTADVLAAAAVMQ